MLLYCHAGAEESALSAGKQNLLFLMVTYI
jgi:hypothetical protein